MELTLQQYERIQKYLDGEMLPDDEELFLKEVKDDSTMQEHLQFELELRLNLGLINEPSLSEIDFNLENQFDDAPNMKSLIENVGNEWLQENKIKSPSSLSAIADNKQKKGVKISLPFWFSIAAAACLLFIVSGIVWIMTNKMGNRSIADNNKKSDSTEMKNERKPEIPVAKTNDSPRNIQPPQTAVNFAALYKKFYKKDIVPEDKPELLADALIDYDNSVYETLQKFDLANLPLIRGDDVLNSNHNVKELGYYYKGLAFLQSNKVTQAQDNLQWVTDSAKNKQLVVKAQWYLALCYLQKQNITKSITLLSSVSNTKSVPYNRQAKELLEVLKQQ